MKCLYSICAMATDSIIRFNQVRNYKQCITDAIRIIVHLPKSIIKIFCCLWGISSILVIAMLYITIFSKNIVGIVIGVILFLGFLWLQAVSLSVQSNYIYNLSQGHEVRTKYCVSPLLKKAVNSSFIYFFLRFCQIAFFVVLSLIMEVLHLNYSYIFITCIILFVIIAYMDFYLLSDLFLRHETMSKSFRSVCSHGLKYISNSLVIYVSIVFLLGIFMVFMFLPTFILFSGMGAQIFATQIGDESIAVPLWVHIINNIFMICAFIIINFLLATSRLATTLFWNTKLMQLKEKLRIPH